MNGKERLPYIFESGKVQLTFFLENEHGDLLLLGSLYLLLQGEMSIILLEEPLPPVDDKAGESSRLLLIAYH